MVDGLIYNAGRIAAADDDTVVNLIDGAQNGLGVNIPNIDGATPMVLSPIVPIVTHIPTMFTSRALQNGSGFNYTPDVCKALMERHAKDISGIDFGYQMEGTGTAVGHDGQELHMPTNAKRTPVNPSFTWNEVAGNLVWEFHRNWLDMIKSPDTQASILAALNDGASMDPMVMSQFSMDMLFIQFDQTMLPENIIDAFFITNMWPQETGMFGAKRTIGHVETIDRTVQYYGLLQHNRNTKAVGQIIAEVLQLHKVNYDYATPVTQSIETNISNMGLEYESFNDQADFVPL